MSNFTSEQLKFLQENGVVVVYYDLEYYHHNEYECLMEPCNPPKGYENTAVNVTLHDIDERTAHQYSFESCVALKNIGENNIWVHIASADIGNKKKYGMLAVPEIMKPVKIKDD